MNPRKLATLLFSHLLQGRVMFPGRQCRVHWSTYTNGPDDPTASIIWVVIYNVTLCPRRPPFYGHFRKNLKFQSFHSTSDL